MSIHNLELPFEICHNSIQEEAMAQPIITLWKIKDPLKISRDV
jgi:hypothetical protein